MEVTCVVDDAVLRSSLFWGEHGVAFLIDTDDGRVLFDTGQSGTVLLHNLEVLGAGLETIDAVAISHGHYDHAGGLPALLEHLNPDTPVYANPELFRKRYSRKGGVLETVGMPLTKEELVTKVPLSLRAEHQQIVPAVWTTGEITERPEKEGSSSHHCMREDGEIVQDRYLDDMALILVTDGRLTVLCGCCHAGLLNTLAHVERLFEQPVEAIAGGLHLTSANEEELEHICQELQARPALRRIYPNHCTGETAFVALTNELGPSTVDPFPAGTTLEL